MTSTDWLANAALPSLLEGGELSGVGRMLEASNATLRSTITTDDGTTLECVYKPVAGERPLWDFPQQTLARRELAAYALSEAAGWHLVPPTVWRSDGPAGPGMCQLWIDEEPSAARVAVIRSDRSIPGWLVVLDAEDGDGQPVQLVHASEDLVQLLALFDAVVNNADRKGGHVITDVDGRIWGIDHGLTFAVEDKLRTVLWGWAGQSLSTGHVLALERLRATLGASFDPVDRWLADEERRAVRVRVSRLLDSGTFPVPSPRWPAIPWPVL